MAPTSNKSDEMTFVDETPAKAAPTSGPPPSNTFKILIVDDDKDVHLVTKQVLSTYFNKADMPVFLHAYNSLDAYTMLAWERDVSVVLLDVVMESDDAGLKLVNSIRSDLSLSRTQIILRTGQPGLAAEDKVIANYEINGYLAKSDLTPSKLYAAVMAARRNYLQLCKEAGVAQSAPPPKAANTALEFLRDSMVHIAALFETPSMGFVLRRTRPDQPLTVVYATPEFANIAGLSLDALKDGAFTQRVNACLQGKKSIIDASAATLFLPGVTYPDSIMHLIRKTDKGPIETQLLDILVKTCVKVSEQMLKEAQR